MLVNKYYLSIYFFHFNLIRYIMDLYDKTGYWTNQTPKHRTPGHRLPFLIPFATRLHALSFSLVAQLGDRRRRRPKPGLVSLVPSPGLCRALHRDEHPGLRTLSLRFLLCEIEHSNLNLIYQSTCIRI